MRLWAPTAGLDHHVCYTPSGKTIQTRGIVPDVMVDDTAEGSPVCALRTRETDLDKHLATHRQGTGRSEEGAGPKMPSKLEEQAEKAAG